MALPISLDITDFRSKSSGLENGEETRLERGWTVCLGCTSLGSELVVGGSRDTGTSGQGTVGIPEPPAWDDGGRGLISGKCKAS